jgi:HEPN domain-containing protein
MKRLTREWARKAEDDYLAAHRLRDESRRFRDQICFHCQQAAEKYLKGILQERGVRFDRTHDLEKLLIALLPTHTRLQGLRRGLKVLRHYAVETRYPGDRATKREADAALRWAQRIREACRLELGIRRR